ncbi:MAG: MGH1-like glycoside hydrolase domain-containing protein [Candidatus Merdivicinus sp.]|jgi:putative isomerase
MERSLLKGWNTFYVRSVLSHLLMPQGFSINLGLKNYSSGAVLGEALIGRFDPDAEQIHPGPRSYDGTYTQLRIRYHGTETLVESAEINGEICLLVTPVKQEKKPMALLAEGTILWNRTGTVRREGDHLVAELPDRTVTVWTDGEELPEYNISMKGPYLSVGLSRPVAVTSGVRRTAEEVRKILDAARQKVEKEAEQYGKLAEVYHAMRTCLAWDTIYEPEKGQLCSPVSRLWSIGWGGYVLFCWDTYFSSMMAMTGNRELAYANAAAITHEKTESGFVPNFGSANDSKSRDRSQPPVGALAVREIYRKYREKEFVRGLFDDLLEWNRWFADNRMLENGQLCWGSNPFEPRADKHFEVHDVDNLQGAAFESGLDNSPMCDDIPYDADRHLMCLADVGLTGLYIADCEYLAELAAEIGRDEVIGELRSRAAHSKEGLGQMWDEEIGMFCNVRTDTGKFIHRISPTNFYALYSDAVTPEQAERMMKEHFYNPEEFWGEYILPSIARNDPAYPDQDYWRGRIWAPLNFLVYVAMRRHGLKQECQDLAEKSKNLLLKEWLEHGHVHENYNGDTGEGCDKRNSDKFYHWGALLSLIAMMDAGYVEGPEKPL